MIRQFSAQPDLGSPGGPIGFHELGFPGGSRKDWLEPVGAEWGISSKTSRKTNKLAEKLTD